MFKYDLEKGLKVNVWINEEFEAGENGKYDKLLIEEDTILFANTKKVIVELFIPRAHNNYALLGVDFLASEDGKAVVKLNMETSSAEKYMSAEALPFDTVLWGITGEFNEGIIRSLDKHIKKQALPSGIIHYNISAYGEIGSSADMFEKVSDILLSILMCNDNDEAQILNIIKENTGIK